MPGHTCRQYVHVHMEYSHSHTAKEFAAISSSPMLYILWFQIFNHFGKILMIWTYKIRILVFFCCWIPCMTPPWDGQLSFCTRHVLLRSLCSYQMCHHCLSSTSYSHGRNTTIACKWCSSLQSTHRLNIGQSSFHQCWMKIFMVNFLLLHQPLDVYLWVFVTHSLSICSRYQSIISSMNCIYSHDDGSEDNGSLFMKHSFLTSTSVTEETAYSNAMQVI